MEKERVLLGITGGIAAYKSAQLVRLLIKSGYDVQVIMTPSAAKFVTPVTFQSLSGNPVYVDLFDKYEEKVMHIDLANRPSLIIIAPATANTLSKIAFGIGDNLLTTVVLAASVPVLLVPSMNDGMYAGSIVQDNLCRLEGYGFYVMEPGSGELACGTEGKGRMPSPESILEYAVNILNSKKDYDGKKVLVTAGPTREKLDPVRYFSNFSTGRMGFAIARAFRERGAEVCLVCGPVELPLPPGMEVVRVNTANEMMDAVKTRFTETDIVVKTAAVADYRPAETGDQKIKKEDDLNIRLIRNPDILETLGTMKKDQVLVGFAAETENLMENAARKLESKNLDFIVANDLTVEGAGFGTDTNKVSIISRSRKVFELPLMSKNGVAHRLLDIILQKEL